MSFVFFLNNHFFPLFTSFVCGREGVYFYFFYRHKCFFSLLCTSKFQTLSFTSYLFFHKPYISFSISLFIRFDRFLRLICFLMFSFVFYVVVCLLTFSIIFLRFPPFPYVFVCFFTFSTIFYIFVGFFTFVSVFMLSSAFLCFCLFFTF